MDKLKNYYQVLEVDLFADSETVKASFRKLARQYHPDLNSGNKAAEEKFKSLNEAYDVLSDPDKRAPYDDALKRILKIIPPPSKKEKPPPSKATAASGSATRPGTAKQEGGEGSSSNIPISELFQNFKKNFQNTASQTPPKPEQKSGGNQSTNKADTAGRSDGNKVFRTEKAKRGDDVTVEAFITPLEAEQGVVKTVNVQHNEICRRCSGTGRVNGLLCSGCNGEKIVVRLKKIDVRIPMGVKHNSKVRIAREGGRGSGGEENGDLFLLIRISVDPSLRIDGLNVYCDLPLQIPEAILGAEIEVPTLTGKVKMTIPPLTSSGKVFRLKEQGVQNGLNKGDQFVTVHIVSPESLLPREKELYQELSRIRTDKNTRRP